MIKEMDSDPQPVSFPVKARLLVFFWFLPFVYLPGINLIYFAVLPLLPDPDPTFFWFGLVYYYYYFSLFSLLIFALCWSARIPWRGFFKPVDRRSILPSLELTAFAMVLSTAVLYLTLFPLSFVFPDFVQQWYLEYIPIVYWDTDHYPWLPNLLSLITLVVMAPILEEFVFRGLLLQRWSLKYGSVKAILLSSALFGIAHPDAVGAFTFGIIMSFLYIRSKSLIVPICCHGLYNLVVWVWTYFHMNYYGPNAIYSLEDFRAGWPWGAAAMFICLLWLLRLKPKIPSFGDWQVPRLGMV